MNKALTDSEGFQFARVSSVTPKAVDDQDLTVKVQAFGGQSFFLTSDEALELSYALRQAAGS